VTRALTLLFVIVVGVGVLHAAQTPPAATSPTPQVRDAASQVPTGTAAISGVVVDDEGKPMRRVLVTFEGDARANRSVVTDDRGRFAATELPAARYAIRAERAGFPPSNYGAKRPGRPGAGLTVKNGERVENITLRMARGAVITGRLFDDRGRPIPFASVTAYVVETQLDGQTSVRGVVSAGSAYPITDDRGNYRFFGLPEGEYIVGTAPFFRGLNEAVRIPTDAEIREVFGSAERASRAVSTETRTARTTPDAAVNYAMVFYGDVLDPLAATRIKLVPGEERTGIDLHARLEPRASISGKVMGPEGSPLPARIELWKKSGTVGLGTGQITNTRPDGSISYTNLAPGDYQLIAMTQTPPIVFAETLVSVMGRDVTDVRLDLAPALTATGRLEFQGTKLTPPDASQVVVSVRPISGYSAGASPGPVTVAKDFGLTFTSMPPGRWRIDGAVRGAVKPGEPTWSVLSVTLGDRDVTDLPFDVAVGQVLPPITVTLTDSGAELSGAILAPDGRGADVFVVAIPSDEQYWMWASRRIKQVRPDATGRYVFANLPAGRYRIAATTELEQGDLQSLTFLRTLVGSSAEVTVGVGEKKVFDLKLGGS